MVLVQRGPGFRFGVAAGPSVFAIAEPNPAGDALNVFVGGGG
jgi:hypothetical protein